MDSTDTSSVAGVGENSFVVTPSGVEKISKIRPGRKVLTEENGFTKVTEVHSTGKKKQPVYKLSVPILSDAFDDELYVTKGASFYGLPKRSDLATEVAVSQLTEESFVFVPNKAKQAKQILAYQLRGDSVVSDKSGVFVPIERVDKTERTINIISLETEAGQFVANGISIDGSKH